MAGILPDDIPGMSMGGILGMLNQAGQWAAPNLTGLLSGAPAPPIQSLPDMPGKVPGTDDPRYGGAVPEMGNILSNFVGPGGEMKMGAAALFGLPAFLRRAAPLAEQAAPEMISGAATRYGGKVYMGVHHGEAMELAAKDTGKTIDEIADATMAADDGFLTSAGRFVSRQEAMEIAKGANQIGLFSRIMQPVKRWTLGKYGEGNPLMSEELK